jgi:hypothetical protein
LDQLQKITVLVLAHQTDQVLHSPPRLECPQIGPQEIPPDPQSKRIPLKTNQLDQGVRYQLRKDQVAGWIIHPFQNIRPGNDHQLAFPILITKHKGRCEMFRKIYRSWQRITQREDFQIGYLGIKARLSLNFPDNASHPDFIPQIKDILSVFQGNEQPPGSPLSVRTIVIQDKKYSWLDHFQICDNQTPDDHFLVQ